MYAQSDYPPDCSPVLVAYLEVLAGAMPAGLRQDALAPFVPRLVGSGDSPDVEWTRARQIVVQTVRRILPPVLRHVGLTRVAKECAKAHDLETAAGGSSSAWVATRRGLDRTGTRKPMMLAAEATANSATMAGGSAQFGRAAEGAAPLAARTAACAARVLSSTWPHAMDIIAEAFAIGRQSGDADAAYDLLGPPNPDCEKFIPDEIAQYLDVPIKVQVVLMVGGQVETVLLDESDLIAWMAERGFAPTAKVPSGGSSPRHWYPQGRPIFAAFVGPRYGGVTVSGTRIIHYDDWDSPVPWPCSG